MSVHCTTCHVKTTPREVLKFVLCLMLHVIFLSVDHCKADAVRMDMIICTVKKEKDYKTFLN